jgi:hypothetical protein
VELALSPQLDPIDAAIAATALQPQPELPLTIKFITGVMKAAVTTAGRKTLHATASSSIEDLHGDTILEEAIRDMAGQIKAKAMNIFLNHRYVVPEDVFGTTYAAQVLSRATETDGSSIWDLDIDVALAESNPRVGKTWELIKEDEVKLGVSIGAQIVEWEYKDKDAGFWGGLIIKRLKLLEASIVGIPANQRSWVQNSIMVIGKDLGIPRIELEKRVKAAHREVAPVEVLAPPRVRGQPASVPRWRRHHRPDPDPGHGDRARCGGPNHDRQRPAASDHGAGSRLRTGLQRHHQQDRGRRQRGSARLHP